MYAFPRPSAPHQEAGGTIFEELRPPFQRGRGGPGGWRILAEPGIRLQGTHEFSPDVAGWRLERLPTLPQKGPIRVVPDWACEVQSPSTRSYDLGIKRRFYAKIGVQYLWYVDPFARTLIASRLVDGQWLEIGAFCDNEKVRVEPFEAIELDLSAWWEGVAPEDAEEPSPSPPSSSL